MVWPPIGIIDIVSSPPAMIVSAPPLRIRSAAIAIDCKPDEQKRLMVMALVSTGKPARIAAARATFIPCSASGIAQPMITSSISAAVKPGTRAMAALITAAPISSGRVSRRVPLGALPTAVRTADTITASFICPLRLRRLMCGKAMPFRLAPTLVVGGYASRFQLRRIASQLIIKNAFRKGEAFPHIGRLSRDRRSELVPQRFPRLQHMRDAILRRARADQRQKSFTLEIEQVLFGNARFVIQISARQNARELLANQRIVIRNVARARSEERR